VELPAAFRGSGSVVEVCGMTVAVVFPGQGSQSVGMGKALADRYGPAREVFAEVDAALSQPLSRLMFEGPDAELTMTANAQPALMAVSLAVLRVLEREAGFDLGSTATFVAGHSLGEYSALAAAGALTIPDTARLLRLRGEAMQKAVPAGEGAMAALLGVEGEQARAIAGAAAEGDICDVANDNGGGQVVVSGTVAAVNRAMAIAKGQGVKRAVLLPVSAPFHCRLMAPAAEAMREALAAAAIAAPAVPVVANVLARPVTTPTEIRDALVAQVCGTVRWRESVRFMADAGVTRFVELGAGKVLAGLIKRIAPGAATSSIGAPEDVAAFGG
jgi:[acyl-carrier-protein] S-malonyltransferase